MLKSWTLTNFKSVVDSTTLDLGPLTIFTGANSSGKSTIIQSILLTAQTIQSSVFARPVVLNGHIARLGSFKDLVSGGDLQTSITVGFSIQPQDNPPDRRARVTVPSRRRRIGPSDRRLQSVSCSYTFSVKDSPSSDLALLQPLLEESSLSVASTDGRKSTTSNIGIARSGAQPEQRAVDAQIASDGLGADMDSLRYEVTDKPTLDQLGSSRTGAIQKDIIGASFIHFLPRVLSVRYDQVDLRVARQLDAILEPFYHEPSQLSDLDSTLSPGAAAFLVGVLRGLNNRTTDAAPTAAEIKRTQSVNDAIVQIESTRDVRRLSRLFRLLTPQDISQILSSVPPRMNELRTLLRSTLAPHYVLATYPLPDELQLGVDAIQEEFVRLVKYLGPLRDEPKPVYPLSGGTDPADVGFRGEHTAAVLDLHKSSLVEYVPSASFETDAQQVSPRVGTLVEAVLDWLQYTGVGTDFSTVDLGKLGHELRISTTGDKSLQHDLTQVGVGVSQLLPILVLALLAERGSVLIFEQPELHLHPRVQSRLADFFVSMMQLGKQCVVETHSEYMITRLRYRVAAALNPGMTQAIKIYFVEKSGPKSSYRPVAINDLGMIENWPSGFFDESENATSALLKKGVEKRRAASKDSGKQ